MRGRDRDDWRTVEGLADSEQSQRSGAELCDCLKAVCLRQSKELYETGTHLAQLLLSPKILPRDGEPNRCSLSAFQPALTFTCNMAPVASCFLCSYTCVFSSLGSGFLENRDF